LTDRFITATAASIKASSLPLPLANSYNLL
jgi:hypothetical protein